MEQLLIVLGAAIFGLLGTIHLIYTFFSNKFEAHDPAVTKAMNRTSPILTKETTIWRAWIGFNASHSLGAMIFAAIYIPLALSNLEVIRSSLWLSILPALVGVSYLILAQKYWFKVPFIGILLSTLCFIGAAISVLLR